MNGSLTPLLYWLLSGAAAVIGALVSAAVWLHIKLDDERSRLAQKAHDELKAHLAKQLEAFEARLHRYRNEVSEIKKRA